VCNRLFENTQTIVKRRARIAKIAKLLNGGHYILNLLFFRLFLSTFCANKKTTQMGDFRVKYIKYFPEFINTCQLGSAKA